MELGWVYGSVAFPACARGWRMRDSMLLLRSLGDCAWNKKVFSLALCALKCTFPPETLDWGFCCPWAVSPARNEDLYATRFWAQGEAERGHSVFNVF